MGYDKGFRPRMDKGRGDFTTLETTSANIKPYGSSIIRSTAAGKVFTLSAPTRAGIQKVITCTRGTTTHTALVYLAAGVAFQVTAASTAVTTRKATFNAGNQSLTLMSVSTAKWAILANNATVTLGTT